MQQQEWLDIYTLDGNDLVRTGRTSLRGVTLGVGEHHLLIQIWVRRDNGDYLIQKRPEHLKNLPGLWATTSGYVQAGEDAPNAAIRELREEMGIVAELDALQFITQRRRTHSIANVYLLERDVADDEIVMQVEEVAAVKWANSAAIQQMVRDKIFYDYGADYFEMLFATVTNDGG